MASYNDPVAIHQTLSGTTTDTVRLSQFWGACEVINRGTTDLTVKWWPGANPGLPSALGAGTDIVPAGKTVRFYPSTIRSADIGTNCHVAYVRGNGNGYSVIGVQVG